MLTKGAIVAFVTILTFGAVLGREGVGCGITGLWAWVYGRFFRGLGGRGGRAASLSKIYTFDRGEGGAVDNRPDRPDKPNKPDNRADWVFLADAWAERPYLGAGGQCLSG